MNQDFQLRLQAYLDGELSPDEAAMVAELITREPEARELLLELTNTRAAMTTHEADVKVPATREFYWSGIRREIERQAAPVRTSKEAVFNFAALRRWLLPTAGLAAVLVAVLLALPQFRFPGPVLREETDTTFADAGAFTYRDYASGTTLVWMDYPAENELAGNSSDDILEFD
jgi:anti-sigma factor RsiW